MSGWERPGIGEHTRAEVETRAIVPARASLVRAARAQGVTDPRVLRRSREVRRSAFVPRELRREVGYDYAIPIGRGQTTSQPSLIALMIEALDLRPDDTVLEIGTGFGYEAALLAKLARQVWSVERIEELAQAARQNLEAEGDLERRGRHRRRHARPRPGRSLRRHRRRGRLPSRPGTSRGSAGCRTQARHARRGRAEATS